MESNKDMHMGYGRFFAMIGTSTVVMFLLMYANTYDLLAHARFSEMRAYMTLIMGAAMMGIMLGFMRAMYKNPRINAVIFVASGVLLLLAVWLVRSQATVTDVDYMEAMIPHHSIAILSSERSNKADVRVQELAQEIIDAQRREIAEMEWLIEDIKTNGPAETQQEAESREIPEFSP